MDVAGTGEGCQGMTVDVLQSNTHVKGHGAHPQTGDQTGTAASSAVPQCTSLIQNINFDNLSFNIERDTHLCKTELDLESLRKTPPSNQYCCGACTRTFKTICYLHDHLKAIHKSGGSYHYDHRLKTAFPKYDSCCQFTQTDSQRKEKYESIAVTPKLSDNTTKGDSANNTSPISDKLNASKSKYILTVFGAEQNEKLKSNKNISTTQELECVKPEQNINGNNLDRSHKTNFNSNRTDGDEAEMKSHTETEKKYKMSVSFAGVDKTEDYIKTRKRKQSTPKSIKTDEDDISGNTENSEANDGKKSVLKIETDKMITSEPLKDPIPDGNCKCDICGAKFSFKRGLLRHEQMKHLEEMRHNCQHCNQKFMREFNLQKHIKCVHTKGHGQKYKEKYRAKKKVKKEKEDSVHITNLPTERKRAEEHVIIEKDVTVKKPCRKKEESFSHKAPHTCNICGHTMPRSKMDVHQRLHSGERPYICHVCGKGLISQNKLKRHMLIHLEVKKHTCDICGAGFQMKYKLRMHQHIHTGKKPYLCSICGAEFNHSSNLATHTRCVHLQIKPFVCPTCGGRYSKRSQLDDHILSHSTEKQYTCRYCGKSFKYYKGMKRHEKNHSEEKNFQCDQCDCKFARRDNLDRHKVSHQEPSLECKSCKKMFRDEKLLRDHEYSHTGLKRFQCVLCGEAYKVANQYYTHMLAAHGIDKGQAKLMHEERQTEMTVLQTIGKHSSVQVDPNLPLRLDAEPNTDSVKALGKGINPTSINVSQMVSGVMEENRSAINVLTRVATQNLRLHSEDIKDEEKLNVIVPPLNPMIVLERNQGFSSMSGASNMNVSGETSSSSTSFVMLTPLSQSRDSLQMPQSGNIVNGNLTLPPRQSNNGQLDGNLRHTAKSRTSYYGSLQMAANQDNGSLTPESVHSTYSIQDARMTFDSLARQHETVSVPLTLMRLSENMMDPPTQRQSHESQENNVQQPGAGGYRIQNMY